MDTEEPKKEARRRRKHVINLLCQQMEFYFSPANLNKDMFMQSLLKTSPYVDLPIFFKFNRIKSLTEDVRLLGKAINQSTHLELSEDGTQVCCKKAAALKENEMDCTIYVENVPRSADHSWVRQIFGQYGIVDYVSLPRYPQSHSAKGFAFVEFATPSMALAALEAFGASDNYDANNADPSSLQSIKTYEGVDPLVKDVNEMQEAVVGSGEIVEKNPALTNLTMESIGFGRGDNNDSVLEREDHAIGSEEEIGKKRKLTTPVGKRNVLEECKSKKRKLTKEVLGKSAMEENEEKESENTIVLAKSVKTEKNEQDADGKKLKKKRKRTRPDESIEKFQTVEDESIHLRVMSKREWKRLRNKYLNAQRTNMQQLKFQIQQSRYSLSYDADSSSSSFKNSAKSFTGVKPEVSELNQDSVQTSTKPQFVPGVLVKLTFEEAPQDPRKLRETIREKGAGGVCYVEANTHCPEVYVRFNAAESAAAYVSGTHWGSMKVLSGDEEAKYWNKIIECWEERHATMTRKQRAIMDGLTGNVRGHEKLVKKAYKVATSRDQAKHIYFDDD